MFFRTGERRWVSVDENTRTPAGTCTMGMVLDMLVGRRCGVLWLVFFFECDRVRSDFYKKNSCRNKQAAGILLRMHVSAAAGILPCVLVLLQPKPAHRRPRQSS